ncbi:MAG: acyl--CoA ligase [Alphaproteobacteria bacterium]|nr:acyl--CoA ligase [Alphaproteobacteria bacterium]
MSDHCRVIHDILTLHAERRPDGEAAVEDDCRLSYGLLAARVDGLARALLAAGIRKGDRVATLAPPGLQFWETYLATVSVGAIWMGLNPRYQRTEYSFLLNDAAPKLVFVRAPYEGRDYRAELAAASATPPEFVTLGTAGEADPGLEAFRGRGAAISDERLAAERAGVAPEDIAVIVYTSGTTGRPKGAMLSHRAIVSAALTNRDWMGDGLESTVCPAPINHVGGLNNVCMNVFAYGGRIIFHHRVDLDELGRISARERPSYLVSSPTGFMMMLSSPGYMSGRGHSTRLIVFGGAATPEPVLARIVPLGARMHCVYGQTETCGIVTRTDDDASLEVMSATIGKPLPGAVIRIGRDDGTPCPAGETGEIQVKAPFVMSGYFNRPEATAEAFTPDGFLRTGDLGSLREDGNIRFVGRLKEMFKSGGYNVYPLEVEHAIAEHPKVQMSVVVPVPHELFQEVGHAFVLPVAGTSLTADELKAFLRERIANYKIPKTFSFESELPLLPNAKLDRQALKARVASRAAE